MTPDSRQTKRAVGYIRVSTIAQEDDGTSLETQDKEVRRRMTERGYNIVGVMKESHTGTELDERPILTKLRQMVRNSEVDTIVVWSFDRLARNMVHQGVILYETEKAGVTVESVKENFDDTLDGSLMRQVVAYMAEKEHQRILERTTAGIRRRVEHGLPLFSGGPLYGYTVNDKRTAYVVNPETAPIVRRIFEMAAAGVSIRKICRILTDDGIPTPRGSEFWYTRAITLILDNPAYYGKIVGFRWKYEKVKSRQGNRYAKANLSPDGGVPLPAIACPALVSEELATKAREARQAVGGGYRRLHPVQLLTGFVECGECGRACRTHFAKDRHYYMCTKSITTPNAACTNSTPGRALDAEVWAWFVSWLDNIDSALAYLFQQVIRIKELAHEAAERELAAEEEQAAFMRAYIREEDELVKADISLSRQRAKDRAAGHRKEREKYDQDAQDAITNFQRAQRNLQKCADRISEDMDLEDKRFLLRLLGVRVVIHKAGCVHGEPRIEKRMHPWATPAEGEDKGCLVSTKG